VEIEMAALGKPASAICGKNTRTENRRRVASRLKPASLEEGSAAKPGDDFIIMSLLMSDSLELGESSGLIQCYQAERCTFERTGCLAGTGLIDTSLSRLPALRG
jgi:hypothetical protein